MREVGKAQEEEEEKSKRNCGKKSKGRLHSHCVLPQGEAMFLGVSALGGIWVSLRTLNCL